MVELAVFVLFILALFLCLILDISVVAALLFGYGLFFAYGLYKKHPPLRMLRLSLSGIATARNILIVFILVGILTGLWRSSGTIAYIVFHAIRFFDPRIMVLITFLLCSLISFLTGTALGTAATMGVICVTMANSMGVPILFSGGAVLSGSYFGDRCSPMSTSALLICSLNKTGLYPYLGRMIRATVVPFCLTILLYFLMGMGQGGDFDASAMESLFQSAFRFHPLLLLPALIILAFSLFKVDVKITMTTSLLAAGILSALLQKLELGEILRIAVFGYAPADPELFALLSGGGVLSMQKVFCIVCVSSCYTGLFDETGLLTGIQKALDRLCEKILPFGGVLLTSLLTGMIACNQTLSIMLSHQLCKNAVKDPIQLSTILGNTAVVVAPLIPWCIAGALPLSSVGAPTACLITSVYLYLIPLWNYAVDIFRHQKMKRAVL